MARRPYFRMRGRPITEEQAFDILCKTDNFFDYNLELPNLITDRTIVDNVWLSPNFSPHRGWTYPNGIIGQNGLTVKYPDHNELLASVEELLDNFPYLDMIILFTDWDEGPNYAKWYYDDDVAPFGWEDGTDQYPDFFDHVVFGIKAGNNIIHFMERNKACQCYREFLKLNEDYGIDDRLFESERNCMHKKIPIIKDYLIRCLEYHGVNPDKFFEEYLYTDEGLEYIPQLSDTYRKILEKQGWL